MSGNRQTRVRHIGKAYFGFPCVVLALLFSGIPGASRAQTPADDVATQIRGQGYQCDWPATARRDVKRSKRDSAVWILNCQNGAYRVRLKPDMAARVTKLK
jgi:hypothetical protein